MKLPMWLAAGVVVVALIARGLVLVALIKYLKQKEPPDYFGWVLLHLGVGIVGLVIVLVLAVFHDLSAAATAIISSVVSFSIGASATKRSEASLEYLISPSPTFDGW